MHNASLHLQNTDRGQVPVRILQSKASIARANVNLDLDKMNDQEVAVWYNDNVIYPNKIKLNCYYYRHYSFIKDIQMILCTVLGKKMEYAGEVI